MDCLLAEILYYFIEFIKKNSYYWRIIFLNEEEKVFGEKIRFSLE